jgi:hypothetical protein
MPHLTLHLFALFLPTTLLAITPGGSYSLLNASSGPVSLQVGTAAHPNQQAWRLLRGFGDGGSGDHSELIFLRVKYPSGRTITFDAEHIRSVKAASQFRRGAWWIDDQGITYLPQREANIRWRHFRR